ncbi:carbamoyltransferase HypF [Pantoea sp. B65]|uniref:carbamoyltransferase HypF n=1 Tax=Pantoea sp. B65 TaxID=2813359 RepID=UPI0039B5600A
MSDSGLLVRVRGKVQGVGFRPFIWQLARRLQLQGEVHNDNDGVEIRLLQPLNVDNFLREMQQQCPPLAQIDSISLSPFSWLSRPAEFHILHSQYGTMNTQVIPDAATCPDCLREMNDATDRRYHYAFLNCTHCGPRFTLIHQMPYDRAATSMAPFPLCAACAEEYRDPADRRFHAQPVACPDCGPQLYAATADDRLLATADAALLLAVTTLRSGGIVAIKGVGGFHLACDATSAAAVARLRARKRRPGKPLAVMLPDCHWLAACTDVSALDPLRALLQSAAAPIVLVPQAQSSPLCAAIAPGLHEVGLMLPSSPLQHLLMQQINLPLVMTSGNAAGHAPALTNAQALSQLHDIADLWLLHDREIVQRADDSVVRFSVSGTEMLRRARGFVPDAIELPPGLVAASPLLAVGGDLKNTFCLIEGRQALLSQHLGTLENSDIFRQWRQTVDHFSRLFHCVPQHLACDAHPAYLSHQWAQQQPLAITQVLHHHAHMAACLAEHHWPLDGGAVIGLALDGIGYGADGELWGGECLQLDYRQCERLGGLPAVALPGGERAAQQPWRNQLAQWLRFVPDWQQRPEATTLLNQPWQTLAKAISGGINAPLASSCGRLFDAVAAASGCAPETLSWEGEAACHLQALAQQAQGQPHPIRFELLFSAQGMTLDLAGFWRQWLDWPATRAARAWAFHDALAQGLAAMAHHAARQRGLNTVVLGGGVIHNALLLDCLRRHLAPLQILVPRAIPAGDGGLAFGQAVVACARLQASISSHSNKDSHA